MVETESEEEIEYRLDVQRFEQSRVVCCARSSHQILFHTPTVDFLVWKKLYMWEQLPTFINVVRSAYSYRGWFREISNWYKICEERKLINNVFSTVWLTCLKRNIIAYNQKILNKPIK